MTAQLGEDGRVFINFKNGTYQWLDIRRFRVPAEAADDTAVLVMLIGHWLYGDDYAGGELGGNPQRHGPYWRDRITPECFDRSDAATEEARLRVWAEQYAPMPELLCADLESELYQQLRTAGRVYRLRDLGPVAFHDWGGVHGEFNELVLVDHTRRGLTLIVAADD